MKQNSIILSDELINEVVGGLKVLGHEITKRDIIEGVAGIVCALGFVVLSTAFYVINKRQKTQEYIEGYQEGYQEGYAHGYRDGVDKTCRVLGIDVIEWNNKGKIIELTYEDGRGPIVAVPAQPAE